MVASYLLDATATHRLEDLSRDLLGEATRRHSATSPARTLAIAAGLQLLSRCAAIGGDRLRETGMDQLFYDVEMPLVGVLARDGATRRAARRRGALRADER